MIIPGAEARQLEILANMLLRLIAEWREQRKKNESAADAYQAGYRAAQEAMEENRKKEFTAPERLARQRWTGMRASDLRRRRDEALEAARMMTAELDDIRRGGLSPEEATRE